MADADTKTVNISATVAKELYGGKRRTTKKARGGSAESIRGVSQGMMQVKGTESSATTFASPPDTATWLKPPAGPTPPTILPRPAIVVPPSQSAAPTNQYTVGGGVKHVKVELRKKPASKKVQLHPKKAEISKSLKKHQTKKARKVTLGVSALHKRMTRAKKVHKKVKEMPLEDLKKQLVAKKLIKATSKAPESVLRQIAADAQIVAGKAL
jgi:hypothetical protein